jgi:uncharacterized membrane protein YdjX (TVP38/TMEM64 family)
MKVNNIKIKNIKLLIIILLIILFTFIYLNEENVLLEKLKNGSIEDLVLIIRGFGIWAPFISIVLMILQAFIAPIPSFLIAGANGIVFGIVFGTIISWIGAMFGATGTFYFSRFFRENTIKKIEQNNSILKTVDDISEKNGFKVILIGRLMPFISFDFLSYAAGLSSISFKDFAIATGTGMIPGTIAYVILGNQIVKYGSLVNTALLILTLVVVLVIIHKYKNKKSV